MKIVFMGTPDFAVPALGALYDSGHEVCAVFTQPDKPKGRGYKLAPPPVKELALKHGTEVFQPQSLKKDPAAAVEILSRFSPDVIAVAAYGKLLPKEVLELPKYGCINIHASLLPAYRGAAPVQRSVLNGDEYTGVTIMQMAEGLDTGDILLQERTPIGLNETSAELFERLSVMGARLLMSTLENIRTVTPVPQDESRASYAAMLTKDMCAVDFKERAFVVNKQICGLSDWPCAVTYLGGRRLKIYKSELVCSEGRLGECGEVINSKRFEVACGSGSVRLVTVQADGGKRMPAEEFLRGRQLEEGTVLGN